MEAEILIQLWWIRWVLVVLCCLVLTAAGIVTVAALYVIRGVRKMNGSCGRALPNIQSLLQQDKVEEAIAAGETRKAEFPRDANNLWWLAGAYRAKGELQAALDLLRAVEEIEPEWKNQYTAPRIAEIEGKLAAATDAAPAEGQTAGTSKGGSDSGPVNDIEHGPNF